MYRCTGWGYLLLLSPLPNALMWGAVQLKTIHLYATIMGWSYLLSATVQHNRIGRLTNICVPTVEPLCSGHYWGPAGRPV